MQSIAEKLRELAQRGERLQRMGTPASDHLPLQCGIVYGPVRSRRLGLSLGVNILPTTYKLCSFNCVYCQYGWTMKPTLEVDEKVHALPKPEKVAADLERSFREILRHRTPIDAVTFSGNGEPTLHPRLGEIVEIARSLRDRYLPKVKLTILSNSSTVGKPEVRDALKKFDLKMMKLDAGNEELFQDLNGPASGIYLGEIVAGLKSLDDVVIQSMFVQGRVTNVDPGSIETWLHEIAEVKPRLVQVYSLDREPAEKKLWKVSMPTLQWIANQVRFRVGVPAEVY
ncbi:MAG TPA: radical SAM protein, partial [Candidatus Binatia bacterium]|nr:radical SAM protein [Candidatus Binatia bacterium]